MQVAVEKHWKIRAADPRAVEELAKEGIQPLLARLLVGRGIAGVDEARSFLAPTLARMHDPYLLAGMGKGVLRLVAALEKGEKVCVHGDYDVDGIAATALLIEFFQAIGLESFWYIPNRLMDGYGLSAEAVAAAAAQGATVMVTVDCGITAVAEAALCTKAGIDLIITDHHMPGDVLPAAYAIINPMQPECSFPFKALSGVGVAFNLLVALRGRLRDRGFFSDRAEPDLRAYLDLVALGTVADVVPLLDENRIFVSYGLQEMTTARRTGIQELKKVAGVSGEVSSGIVGFRLAPRLNACGRLDDASLGVELLLTADRAAAEAMAAQLDAGNAERQALEKTILSDALAMVRTDPASRDRKSIVLASADWHAGVIGIVASRLVDFYHRPTILIAMQDGNGKGSGRSIPAFHLHDAVKACEEHLLKFGGHKHAVGLGIAEETLDAFVERFAEVADGLLTAEDLIPVLTLDGELPPEALTVNLVEAIEKLKPFGMGNPEPLFILRNAEVTNCRALKDNHLKFSLTAGGRTFEAIAFGMAGRAELGDILDVVFSPAINSWNGKTSLQLTVKDLRTSGGDNAEN